MTGAFDCTACGACCVEAGAVTVMRGEDVPHYLTRSVRNRIGFASWEADEGTRQMDKHMGGRCKALKGVVGQACRCGIYERRPEVCREYLPGSDGCLDSRERMRRKMEPEQAQWRPRGYGENWQETVR